MRIGDLATRTQVSTRMLRYYEEQGLLDAARTDNGYRWYPESLVDRVLQIRGLLDVGLPVKVIMKILPCLDNPCTIHLTDPSPGLVATLEEQHARMQDRIECLTESRDAIAAYLDAVRNPRPTPIGVAGPSAFGPTE